MGHEVTVYCRNYFTPEVTMQDGMRIVRLPTFRSKHLDTLVHTLISSMHVLFTRADLVHYHALGPALFSWIPRLAGKKTLVTVQGLDWQRKKWGRIASLVLRLGQKAAIYFPNRTMVVSRVLQEHFGCTYGARTSYIPNGTILRPKIACGRLQEWHLEAGNYILFLGRFSPEKNCHLLIDAFERAQVPSTLVLAGGSSYSDKYIESLRAHSNDKVRLLDYVSGDALQELLTNAALFVLPSDMEGLSLALLDAMGAGICVLASDIPENIELVNGAGFTFRRGDVEDLARMLRLLMSDPVLRAEASEKGRQHVAAHYLWPGIAQQIELEYLNVLGLQSAVGSVCSKTKQLTQREPAA
jgi:glycosyltransferase involved in cell wall biosynthesis